MLKFTPDRRALQVVAGIMSVLLALRTVPAKADEMVCRQAAASLRVGDAAPSTPLNGINGVAAAKEEGGDAVAVLRAKAADPGLLHAIEDVTAGGRYGARVQWLRQDELGAVEVIAGTADCQTLLFFRVSGGKAVGIPGPDDLNTSQACRGDSVRLGTIGGIPYAIEENDTLGDRGRSITASAWSSTGWDQACSLIETHTTKLVVDGRYCRAGLDCTALEVLALERARQAQAEHERVTPAIGPAKQEDASETSDATITALPQAIPTFGAATAIGFTDFTNQREFRAVDRGQPVVGAIGGGHLGWRDYDGWLVGFWQPRQDGYEPLAGFQISRRLGAIRSLDVQDHRRRTRRGAHD